MRGAPQKGLAAAIFLIRARTLRADFWAPAALPSRDLGPEEREAFAMPGHHRLRSDDDQGSAPVLPDSGEAQPEQTIWLSQSWLGTAQLEHRELLAKGQVFQCNFPHNAKQNHRANQRTKLAQPRDSA